MNSGFGYLPINNDIPITMSGVKIRRSMMRVLLFFTFFPEGTGWIIHPSPFLDF